MDVNVCLLGGGTRLASHLGALKGIEDHGGRVRALAGASAGSLVAAVLAGGFTHEMAVDLMRDTNYRQFLDIRPLGLIRGFGLCSGRKFEQWLDGILKSQRFEDLQTPLSVICTNIQAGEPFVFSRETTPEVKVATAVRCSIGIPGIFAVRRLKGAVLIDGSLAAIEDHLVFPDSPHETVTIRLVRDNSGKLPASRRFGLSTYVLRVAGMLLDSADEPSMSGEKWRKTLLVRTGLHSSVDFDLPTEARDELYAMGYEQCLDYLDLSGDQIRKRPGRPQAEASVVGDSAWSADDNDHGVADKTRGTCQNFSEGLGGSIGTNAGNLSRGSSRTTPSLGQEAV